MDEPDRRRCRSCGHTDLEPVLDLGTTALADRPANARPSSTEPEPVYPLEVGLLPRLRPGADLRDGRLPRSCSARTIPYFSSFSDYLLRALPRERRWS